VEIGKLTKKSVGFKDIEGHYAEDIIKDLASKGILKGVSEDKYEPDRLVTRAEMAVIADRIIKYLGGK
jgi:hypothetical protein